MVLSCLCCQTVGERHPTHIHQSTHSRLPRLTFEQPQVLLYVPAHLTLEVVTSLNVTGFYQCLFGCNANRSD